MYVKVIYKNNEYDTVKPILLDELITSGQIDKFLRSEGWATIGIDPIRGTGGYYSGPDRRHKSEFESLNDDDKTKGQLIKEVIDLRQCITSLEENKADFEIIEKALKESENRYRAIVEAFDGLIYICSQDYRIKFMNRQFIERTGYDATGELCYKALHDLDSICPWCVNERVFKGETVRWEIQSPKDNHWYYIVNTPIYHTNGTLSKQAMIIDITEIKKTEEELKRISKELARSNAELKDFAYIASHDLKKPLQSIESFAKLLARRYKGKLDAKADEFISYIVEGVQRLQILIKDLLEYSQIETKAKNIKPTDCSFIVEEAMSNLKTAMDESNAVVTYNKLPTIMSDPQQIISLFQNLIDNAIKFRSNKAPRVRISADRKGNEWIFSIRDNGIGIDPENFEKIFVMFQRLHGSADFPGTGIGLSICKKIIERHGGRIWVESEPGKGATFFFVIPSIGNAGFD
jgi:signal transduction histidine kinase